MWGEGQRAAITLAGVHSCALEQAGPFIPHEGWDGGSPSPCLHRGSRGHGSEVERGRPPPARVQERCLAAASHPLHLGGVFQNHQLLPVGFSWPNVRARGAHLILGRTQDHATLRKSTMVFRAGRAGFMAEPRSPQKPKTLLGEEVFKPDGFLRAVGAGRPHPGA